MTTRRFKVTYWLGNVLYITTLNASNSESACVGIPNDAEDLRVRKIEP